MTNRHLFLFCSIFIIGFLNLNAAGNVAESDSTSHGGSAEWTDEQFRAYEDSLLKALYPEVRECHYEGDVPKSAQQQIRKSMSYPEDEICNPVLPSTVTIDKTVTGKPT